MRLCSFTRLLAAAGTVLVSAPALGQTPPAADVQVTMSLNGETTNRGKGLTVGGEETYVVTVTNLGPSHVTAFTVNATFTPPAAAPYNAAIEIGSVTADGSAAGCEPASATAPAFPCTVTLDAPLLLGESTEVSIPVTVPAPDPLPTDAAACPADTATVHATATVSNVLQGTTAVTDPTGNNTASPADTFIRKFTDLEVVSIDGPTDANEGQTVTYTGTIRNNGPCPATNVFVDFVPASTLNFVSATGCDNNTTFGPADDAGCDLSSAPVAVGESKTFTATFSVNSFPKSIIKANIPVDVAVASTSPSSSVAAVDDLNPDNDAGSTSAKVDLSDNDSGCSTGGAGTLVALLGLVALRLRRRAS